MASRMRNGNVDTTRTMRNRHRAGRAISSAALVLLLLPIAAYGAASSEPFDEITAQIVSTIDHFDNDSTTDWDFTQVTPAQIAIAGQANGGTFTNGLTTQSAGDRAIFLNYNGISPTNDGGGMKRVRVPDLDSINLMEITSLWIRSIWATILSDIL